MTMKKKPGKSEFVIVWEFRVRSGKRREFERVYGPDGDWARLFRTGKGYICTELVRDLKTPRRYLTFDRWASRQAYERFKKENRTQYQAIDETSASLADGKETFVEFKKAFYFTN